MKLLEIIIALAYIILSIILLYSNNLDIIASHILGIIAGLQLMVLIKNLILIIKTKSIN